MEEKSGKGISLRQKRGGKLKIGAPTLISGPASLANATDLSVRQERGPPGAGLPGNRVRPRERPRNNDKTSDLVQRRYTLKAIPQNFDPTAPPAPSLPSLPPVPSRFGGQQPPRGGKPTEGRTLKADPLLLKDSKFEAESYVSSVLADASEQEIDSFQRDLRQLKNRADVELQHNVFQNRTQFIKISKEAEKLKGELRSLRSLMSELTGSLGQATVAGGASALEALPQRGRGRGNRSSVANLEALWNSHLQSLWKRVEGSQKFLPAIPGRHVIYESGRWVELSSATWKPRRKVHIILLNDHLLIATEKKRAEAPRDPKERQPAAQLVAMRCWQLQDVQLADLSMRTAPGTGDGAKSSNAVNIRIGSESFTFATASNEGSEKLSLISNFRKTTEDLRRKLETETQERERAQEAANALGSPLLKSTFSDPLSGGVISKSDMLVDVDGKPQSLRWVESQIDDLDIDMALQRFEEAVARIEKLRRVVKGIRGNTTAHEVFGTRLDERASKLAVVVTKYLADTHSWLTVTQRNVDWLVRLGYEDRAREAYLEARTQIIQKRIRQVIFDGDLHLYIYQISFIYFTIIKDTAMIYQSCFPIVMLSACVKWAKEHVDGFNALLERQLSSVDESSDTHKECMERAYLHASMLNEVGLDFKNLVGRTMRAGGA